MNNAKYWALYYADKVLAQSVHSENEMPVLRILTKAGLITGHLCPSPDETAEDHTDAKTIANVLSQVAAQTCFVSKEDSQKGQFARFPFDDSAPLFLRNVKTPNNPELPYMLIFPSEIIGISI